MSGFIICRSDKAVAGTGINQQVNYQARLLNAQGAAVPDGTYNIQFKIYQNGDGTTAGDASGSPAGTLMWTEAWQNSNSQGITVKNGYFSVQLGAICALSGGSCQGNTNTGVSFNQSILWLSVNVGGTSAGASPTYDGEMLPMRQFAAAPYALNSNMLGGFTAAQFLQLAPASAQTDSSSNSSVFVNKTSGTGNLTELQSSGSDVFTIGAGGDTAIKDTSVSAFKVQTSGSSSVLSVDTSTSGGRVTIGTGASGSSTPALLILASKNDTSSDPTEVDGAMYYNAIMRTFRCGQGGVWRSCLSGLVASITSVPAGNTIANTTTETAFASTYQIPANDCQPGRVYHISAMGVYSVTGTPSIRLKFKTVGSTTVTIGDSLASSVTAVSGDIWTLNFNFTCDTAGTSGTIEPEGMFDSSQEGEIGLYNQSSGVGSPSVIDTTQAQTIQMTVKWSAASASDTITLRQFTVEALGP